jgi:hypothetical protein
MRNWLAYLKRPLLFPWRSTDSICHECHSADRCGPYLKKSLDNKRRYQSGQFPSRFVCSDLLKAKISSKDKADDLQLLSLGQGLSSRKEIFFACMFAIQETTHRDCRDVSFMDWCRSCFGQRPTQYIRFAQLSSPQRYCVCCECSRAKKRPFDS